MEQKTFVVPNIGCNGCVNAIKGEIEEMSDVKYISGVVDTKEITVEMATPDAWQRIVDALTAIEYAPAEA
jgi:copper chaperone CopZ